MLYGWRQWSYKVVSLKGHLKGECDSHIGNSAETEKRSGTIVSTLMLRDPSEFRVGSQHPAGVFYAVIKL